MGSGGHGSTTSVSRSWSGLTRRAGDSGASQPRTTRPRLPAGLCSEPMNKVLTLLTHASNDATKPKTFQDADREGEREVGWIEQVLISIANNTESRVQRFYSHPLWVSKFPSLDSCFTVHSCPHSHVNLILLLFGSLILLAWPSRSARNCQNQVFCTKFLDIHLHIYLKCFFSLYMYIDLWYVPLIWRGHYYRYQWLWSVLPSGSTWEGFTLLKLNLSVASSPASFPISL